MPDQPPSQIDTFNPATPKHEAGDEARAGKVRKPIKQGPDAQDNMAKGRKGG